VLELESNSLGDFAAAQAAGADALAAACGAYALKIGHPAALGLVVGVRNVVAHAGLLIAYLTNLGHGAFSLIMQADKSDPEGPSAVLKNLIWGRYDKKAQQSLNNLAKAPNLFKGKLQGLRFGGQSWKTKGKWLLGLDKSLPHTLVWSYA
jgi:hypothetical protein